MPANPKPHVIRLKGKAYTKFRSEVFEHYEGLCAVCGCYAPLMDDGVFSVFDCGHVAHNRSRSIVGDILSAVSWKCPKCHHGKEHGPRWSEKGKP